MASTYRDLIEAMRATADALEEALEGAPADLEHLTDMIFPDSPIRYAVVEPEVLAS